MTACEACRSAKVKCNGHRNCELCRNRGHRCTYAPPLNAQNSNEVVNENIGAEPRVTSKTQTTPDPMSVDLTGDIFSIPGGSSGTVPSTIHPSLVVEGEHWQEQTSYYSQKLLLSD
ncbi:hypothetical protein N7510_005459 [Penicillium lagena]|uniref:uncharacterized protein n=1 Tax=Penicillium lagena TaxID=94218 RepID=UPI002540F894|nr:uncharacterized protein N7510_005459 [Penicillium lagena]KAJ5612265.1 hypothetical protein N7510_005459 [Penicillium lagena]